jgi:hypothetical protein
MKITKPDPSKWWGSSLAPALFALMTTAVVWREEWYHPAEIFIAICFACYLTFAFTIYISRNSIVGREKRSSID